MGSLYVTDLVVFHTRAVYSSPALSFLPGVSVIAFVVLRICFQVGSFTH
jgi:hypothetical protein